MSRQPTVEVQHWIRAARVQTVTGRPEHNLFEVATDYAVPADTEFPRVVSYLDMFVRVVGRYAGETRSRVRVHHKTRLDHWELRNDFERPQHRLALPSDRVAFLDRPIRLANVSLGGIGLYAVTLYVRPANEADDNDGYNESFWDREETPWDPEEVGWEFGAVEYFRVQRPS